MVLNSFTFFIFFSLFGLVYFLSGQKLKMLLLLLASVIFYSFSGIFGLLILGALTVFNYYTGIWIEKSENKNFPLSIAVILNIAVLFLFKFYNFFFTEVNSLFSLFEISISFPMLQLIMPVGISYFILQAIGYNVDIQREMQSPERNFLVFANYFLFFPKALQGPVDRPRLLMPQFYEEKEFDYSRITSGLRLIAWGLFKKLVIADRLGIFVGEVYGNLHEYSGPLLLLAGFFYTFQLYADFSGYMDMALGVSVILGFSMFRNFNKPFGATSVTDFWKRWHISLSTWLYEYVFNPVSLYKRNWGIWGMVFAVFITFLLSGLWHGASWIFIWWGMLNGIALGYEIVTAKWRKKIFKKFSKSTARRLSIGITFTFTILSFTFARAATAGDVAYIFQNIFDFTDVSTWKDTGAGNFNLIFGSLGILLILFMHWWEKLPDLNQAIAEMPIIWRWSFYCLAIVFMLQFGIISGSGFIYAQF